MAGPKSFKFFFFLLFLRRILTFQEILTLNLNSAESKLILGPLFEMNQQLAEKMENITILDLTNDFLPLFEFIVSNQTIYFQLIPRLQILTAFKWSSPMTTEHQRQFIQQLMNSSLHIFYNLMMENLFLTKQANCQELLDAILNTQIEQVQTLILQPVSVQYFAHRRCFLLLSPLLPKVDQARKMLGEEDDEDDKVGITDQQEVNQNQKEIEEFDLQEKLQLIPTLKRINIVRPLIFPDQS